MDSNLQKLCGYEPDNEPPTVYGENDANIQVSSHGTISPSAAIDIETGLEVDEKTVLVQPIHLPDALRLVNVKGVAAISASIAAAQAALTSTLTPPTPQRKLKTISAAAAAGGNNNSSTSSVLSNGAGGPAASCSTSKTAASTSYSFADEVQAVGVCSGSADAISLSEIDEAQRSLTAGFRTAKHQIVLHVTLPSLYPNSCAPSFQFGKGTTIGSSGKSKVYKVRRRRRQDDFFYFLKEQILITKVVN